MRFSSAIDDFITDLRSQGRINSPNTEELYRRALNAHCDDVSNRDPSLTGRDDVKRTLRRWAHPNSQRQMHSIIATFYDWAIEEDYRSVVNPARQIRRAKRRPTAVFRPTREEVVRLLDTSQDDRRDCVVIHLGVLAGIRNAEMRGLQRRHFERDGYVWVSADIGKRGKERWVPVLPELEPIVEELLGTLSPTVWDPASKRWVGDFVAHSRRRGTPRPENRDLRGVALSQNGLLKLVQRVGQRAALGAEITPHTLRHAFGDHIARYAGLRAAQAMLGHENVATTETYYTGSVSLDELTVSVHGFTYRRLSGVDGLVDGSVLASAHYGGSGVSPAESENEDGEVL